MKKSNFITLLLILATTSVFAGGGDSVEGGADWFLMRKSYYDTCEKFKPNFRRNTSVLENTIVASLNAQGKDWLLKLTDITYLILELNSNLEDNPKFVAMFSDDHSKKKFPQGPLGISQTIQEDISETPYKLSQLTNMTEPTWLMSTTMSDKAETKINTHSFEMFALYGIWVPIMAMIHESVHHLGYINEVDTNRIAAAMICNVITNPKIDLDFAVNTLLNY